MKWKLPLIALLVFSIYRLVLVPPVIAQSPIQCGLQNEPCCNLAGGPPNACQIGLKCENNLCIPDGSGTIPPNRGYITGKPIPQPAPIPCDTTKDPEFHSDRPYQASPCGDASIASFCGDILTVSDSVSVPLPILNPKCKINGDKYVCKVTINKEKDIAIKLSNSEFPIMGNTQLVQSSQTKDETLDDAQKVNEYVSWYLNGVTDKAEYGKTDLGKIVDYSGPIKKLLPGVFQDAQRIKTIKNIEGSSPENHNQITVCGESEFGIIGDIFNIGTITPEECYKGNGSKAQGEVFKLGDWNDGSLSWARGMIDTLVGAFIKILPGTPAEVIFKAIGIPWNKRTPPLPWNNGTGKPFESYLQYRKAYNEWRGKSCLILPIVNKLVCIDTILVPNKWADLYPYVPLGNTTDSDGQANLKELSVGAGSNVEIDASKTSYNVTDPAKLYFAHTIDVKDLSEILKKTFTPAKTKPGGTTNAESNDCQLTTVRSNPGDNLFPGELRVKVNYTVTQITCPVSSTDCQGDIGISLTLQTNTPNADEAWTNLVAGSSSVFKRIYPKIDENAPVSCIADIPAISSVTYSGDVNQGGNLYFSHIGSVSEYFLKGIQTALRPKGYSEGQPISGQSCTDIVCSALPALPQASGSCKLGSTSPRLGSVPQALKDILSAAAQTYKVPPNLILGVMYGEGAFNPGRYNWTDQNVKNWASCQKLPNCSGPSSSVVPFFDAYWDNLANQILPDLKKIDPTKTKADPCNLLDAIFALTKDLHNDAGGSLSLTGKSCLNQTMSSTVPYSCDWGPDQYETAIRVWNFGTAWGNTPNGFLTCATETNSCFTGGGVSAQCSTDTLGNTDTCDNSSAANSHNVCVWDVAHSN